MSEWVRLRCNDCRRDLFSAFISHGSNEQRMALRIALDHMTAHPGHVVLAHDG